MRGLKRRSFKLRERKENAFLLIISDKYGEESESPSFVLALAEICKIFPVIDESLYTTINSTKICTQSHLMNLIALKSKLKFRFFLSIYIYICI